MFLHLNRAVPHLKQTFPTRDLNTLGVTKIMSKMFYKLFNMFEMFISGATKSERFEFLVNFINATFS